MPESPIRSLLEYSAADRKLRAYAYLTATFQTRPELTDALDCLIPFVRAGISEQAGNLLDFGKLSEFLQNLGLSVPLYVLNQLANRLQRSGILEWNKVARRFICKGLPSGTEVSLPEASISRVFDFIESELARFASRRGVESPPASDTWNEALIAFLRSETAASNLRTINVRYALVGDIVKLETVIIALFIQQAEQSKKDIFDAILRVYTGILIEDFIINIQEVGDAKDYSRLSIYYDTTVLLRLLGTSGRVLQTTTLEMHRSLQDLGCKTLFLEHTSTEISTILDAILFQRQIGNEIFGETGEALASGEIEIGVVRDLSATFEHRLGALGVFPYIYNLAGRRNEDAFQIDELSFAGELESAATRRHYRGYSRQNSMNDARAVAIIMRLRKGRAPRALNEAGHVFVSINKLLQTTSRFFCENHVDFYSPTTLPPVLTAEQIATAAWLVSSRTLEPIKVTRELLATCLSAVRPTANWAEEFARTLKRFADDNPDVLAKCADSFLFLQAARNTAREESLGEAAILRKLNFTDILTRAAQEADRLEQDRVRELQAASAAADKRVNDLLSESAERELRVAEETRRMLEQVAEQTRMATHTQVVREARDRAEARMRQIAGSAAAIILRTLQISLAIALAILLFCQMMNIVPIADPRYVGLAVILAFTFVLSVLDLFGVDIACQFVARLQTSFGRRLGAILIATFLPSPDQEHLR